MLLDTQVKDGDQIQLDVSERMLQLLVSEDELTKRKSAWEEEQKKKPDYYPRGFGAMYAKHVTQAHLGCDFDFLHAGGPTPEPSIHH